MKCIIMIILLSGIIFCDDIEMKDGSVIKNVIIKEIINNHVTLIKGDSSEIIILKDAISRVIKSEFIPGKIFDKKLETEITFPRAKFLTVSLVSFLIAWDCLGDASDINKQLDELNKIDPYGDYTRLEDTKSRKSILGYILIGVGVINAVYSMIPVEVSTAQNKVNLTYRF